MMRVAMKAWRLLGWLLLVPVVVGSFEQGCMIAGLAMRDERG
jgi:hypothetical protein